MKRYAWICVGLAAIGAVGCGGGSAGGVASTPPPVGGGTPFATGNFQGMAAATNPPVTTAAQFTVATGLTGTITQLKLRDQHVDLSDTRIAYCTPITGGGDAYIANIDGTNVTRLTNTGTLAEENPRVSPAGNKIVMQEFDSTFTYKRHLVLYRSDGLFLAQVSPLGTGTQEQNGAWSPDSSKIMYEQEFNGPTHLVQYTLSGAVTTPIDTGGDAYQPAWSSQNKLAFVSARSGHAGIWVSNADGSNPTEADGSVDSCSYPTWSPDGDTLYWIDWDGANNHLMVQHRYFWGFSTTGILTTTDGISDLHASPDGQYVAFVDTATSPPSIQRIPVAGGSASIMFSPPFSTYGFSWGPMVNDRLIVGSGGLLGATASGFVYADAGGHTQSVLAFTAVTPSSAILRAMTGIGGTEDSLVFTVDADTINAMQYANNPAWVAIPVVLGGTSTPTANGAVISIGAIDGQVNAVLPFSGSRAAGSRPTVTRQGSNYVFSGEFLSALDKNGKNVAPAGASRIVLDPKTGVLTAN